MWIDVVEEAINTKSSRSNSVSSTSTNGTTTGHPPNTAIVAPMPIVTPSPTPSEGPPPSDITNKLDNLSHTKTR